MSSSICISGDFEAQMQVLPQDGFGFELASRFIRWRNSISHSQRL
jgi:hypothetical protein